MKDLHVHTTFSDGANTPREMIEAAIEKGLTVIGFSDHSYTSFDESYCLKKGFLTKYVDEINALKKEYADKIEVKLGLEQDYFSDYPSFDFDYLIGSVHYVKVGAEYLPVDESQDIFVENVNKYFGGDYYAFAKHYYELLGDVPTKTGADILGHFDLVVKFNEGDKLFSTKDERYSTAWKQAADKLLKTDIVFEVNTGAVSRGYKKTPYPSFEIIEYLKTRGGKFVLSSDSHSSRGLCYAFSEFEYLLK